MPLLAPVHTLPRPLPRPLGEAWTPRAGHRGAGGRLPSCLEDEAIGDGRPPSPHGGPRLPHSLGASLLTQESERAQGPAGHPGHPRLPHTRE